MGNIIKGTWAEFLASVQLKAKMQTAYENVSVYVLVELFKVLEQQDFKVNNIYLNDKTYVSVRKWSTETGLEIERNSEKVSQGYRSKIWGADIITSEIVPDNIVLATSERDSVGALLILNVCLGPKDKKLIDAHEKLRVLAGTMQSLLSEVNHIILPMVTKFEKID
jgi:hypothetical protein